jgi:hypothetical protein
MRKGAAFFTLILSILIWTSSIHALPIIDFADSSFSVVGGKNTETVNYGGLEIVFSSLTAALLTYNPGPGGGVDGIGIRDDEISLNEILEIGFSTDLYLSKIYITDLFYEGNAQYQEQGKYKLLTDSIWTNWAIFEAPLANLSYPTTNGEYEIELDPSTAVSSIQFAAVYPSRNDYSVRGVDVSHTPEPATMLLVGTGLIGLAAFGRKKNFFKK